MHVAKSLSLYENPAAYKPRVCIVCKTLEDAKRLAKLVNRRYTIVSFSEVVAKEGRIDGSKDRIIIVTGAEREMIRALRLIDSQVPVVVIGDPGRLGLRVTGRELNCYRALV